MRIRRKWTLFLCIWRRNCNSSNEIAHGQRNLSGTYILTGQAAGCSYLPCQR
jgi:hypothetical protein